jgi:addiction module HigA family antidote
MGNSGNKKYEDYSVEFKADSKNKWSSKGIRELEQAVEQLVKERPPERKLKNEMLSIRYRMEAYVDTKSAANHEICTIEMFLKEYLEILEITFKRFSQAIDTTDSNLKKYLSDERRFNMDLAMKFGHFFHTSPDLWLNVQAKNDLLAFMRVKDAEKYEKYDYVLFSQLAV